jgi:protein-disulfide isomerase
MKKIITIVVVIFVVLGFAFFLFKISPQQEGATSSGYNSALSTSGAKPITSPSPFDPATDHYQGDIKAKNVLVEYADYQCPACAAFSDILKQAPTVFKDTVFVFRYFPLVQIHKNSVESAMAAEAAGAQGKYWEMHDILFQKQTDWSNLSDPLDAFTQYAQSIGVVNLDQFKSDITSKKYLPAIEKDNNDALGLNLSGTPSFFFNGHSLKSDQLKAMEEQAKQFYVK